jgi:hypothetical protein
MGLRYFAFVAVVAAMLSTVGVAETSASCICVGYHQKTAEFGSSAGCTDAYNYGSSWLIDYAENSCSATDGVCDLIVGVTGSCYYEAGLWFYPMGATWKCETCS